MLKVALRGFGARRARAVLTALSVALGVALIAGTYVLTDTIDASFDRIFQQANANTDVTVTPKPEIDVDGSQSSAVPTVPGSVLPRIQRLPEVRRAAGGLFSQVTIFDPGGDRIGAGGAPSFVSSLRGPPFEAFTFVAGRPPRGDGETALDRASAKRFKVKLGESVRVVGAGQSRRLRVVGLSEFAGQTSFGGASVVVTTLRAAQDIAGSRGRFDTIEVAGRPGVSPERLKREVRTVTPRDLRVETGQEDADRQSKEIRDQLGFLRTFLLVFAGIALFVGAFLIFNTFSITVAQRTREFALLRTLGAKRRQVLRSVIVESLVLGGVGALAGLGLGIALAPGLEALFRAFGAELPSQGMVIAARTVVVALGIGVFVTVLSSLAPALRATRVPPIAALREGAVLPRGRGARFATPVAVVLALLGAVGVLVGLFAGGAIGLVAVGAIALFLGVALLTPKLVAPIASTIGRPLPGVAGRLARENAMRLPGRTAVTAAALMVGVALVAFASIFAAGARSSIDKAVDNALGPDVLIVQNTNNFGPIPRGAGEAIARVPGVRAVSPVAFSRARVAGHLGTIDVSAIDPPTFAQAYRAKLASGRLRDLGADGALVKKGFGPKVGDRLRVTTPLGRRLTLTVRGVADDKGGLLADLTVTTALARSAFGEREDALNFVVQRGAKERIAKLLDARFPVAEVLTAKEFKDRQANQINQLLVLIYVLLALSVLVSLFGIVNTLALSIHERTRELGMLRAIGASRRQVRRMVRYEAVITSMLGAIVGVVLGTVIAAAVAQPLRDEGFVLSIPVGTLVALIVLAGLAGVLTAIGPARRAARLDVLRALAYE